MDALNFLPLPQNRSGRMAQPKADWQSSPPLPWATRELFTANPGNFPGFVTWRTNFSRPPAKRREQMHKAL
jgi:hypothetical protein